MKSESFKQRFANAYRNPVYIAYSLAGVGLYWLGSLIASQPNVGILERTALTFFNRQPTILEGFFTIIAFFGTIYFCLLISLLTALRKRYSLAIRLFIAGSATYITTAFLKGFEIRQRPGLILENIAVREHSLSSTGFPSGHAAMATALAIVLYQYTPKSLHRYITIMVGLVFVSRLYLGVHLPIDLLGGFAVGLVVASAWSFILGNPEQRALPAKYVKKALARLGYPVATVTAASLDARGSTPYFVSMKNGTQYFVKVVGKGNNIADWLFKLWRKIVYRRLEDEVPFLTPKRQLEHESYVAGLAFSSGVRTPKIAGVFEVADFQWAQMQESIPGKSLDRVDPSRLTDEVLIEIWKQITLLHEHHIVHRDLRTANVFLDNENNPWIIDFGFSEGSAKPEATVKDTVELLASLACLVGVDRAVQSASTVLPKQELRLAQPYLSYDILSSATTKALKSENNLLDELRSAVAKITGVESVKVVKSKRFIIRLLSGIALIVLFLIAMSLLKNIISRI